MAAVICCRMKNKKGEENYGTDKHTDTAQRGKIRGDRKDSPDAGGSASGEIYRGDLAGESGLL